jgi:hypothetical protein
VAEWERLKARAHGEKVTKRRYLHDLTFVSFPITKREEQPDGSVVVWGPCTTDEVDSDQQVIDPTFATTGLSKWLATGANIREMHQPKAIGLGVELVRKDNAHWLRSRIIEPVAARLTKEGVLRAYSVGISRPKIDYARNPKARGGTIVDGEFVEVSLVDRPANASCKVEVVKLAKNGDAEFTDIVSKMDEAECTKKDYSHEERMRLAREGKALPDGSYPIDDAEDLHNAAILARSGHGDVAAAKRLIARRAKELGVPNPLKDDSKSDSKKGKVPEVDEEVTDALDEAERSVEDAQEAQERDNEGHEEGREEKAEAPYVLKRLHDHLCWAYDEPDVAEEYPSAPSLKDALELSYWAKAISTALAADGGTGSQAHAVAGLSGAYGAAVNLAKADSEVVRDARAKLHKAFSDMYPSVSLKPSSVVPGRFRRPFISAGRAPMHATGKPRIPMQEKVPRAEDFERGYLADHRERNSPTAGPPHTTKGRQFYTREAREQATQAMRNLHDYITQSYPDVCSMSLEEAEAPASIEHPEVDNCDNARPEPVTKALVLEDGQVDIATLQKMIADAASAQAERVSKKMQKQNAKLAKKYRKTNKALRTLKMQADPGAMAYRGGHIGPVVNKAARATAGTEVDPAEVAKREEVEWLKGQVRSGDPAISRPAVEKLQGLLTADELADVLTSAR